MIRRTVLRETRGLGPLLDHLGDADFEARSAACEMLGQLGDARAAPSLVAVLGDSSWRVRQAACEALGLLGDARAQEPVIERLNEDSDCDVREAACEALARLGDRQAIEPLISRLGDRHARVRWAARRALAKLHYLGVTELLIQRLADPNRYESRAAARALEDAREGRLAQAVLQALEGKQEGLSALVRLAAEGDLRWVAPVVLVWERRRTWAAPDAARKTLKKIAEAVETHVAEWLCSVCLARLERRTAGRPGDQMLWYACRTCGQAGKVLMGAREVVAVLDENWSEEIVSDGGVLRVNWLIRRGAFDFDRIEVVAASDYHLERLCIVVGNDTDERRGAFYGRMRCWIMPQCRVSAPSLNLLRETFGEVAVRQRGMLG